MTFRLTAIYIYSVSVGGGMPLSSWLCVLCRDFFLKKNVVYDCIFGSCLPFMDQAFSGKLLESFPASFGIDSAQDFLAVLGKFKRWQFNLRLSKAAGLCVTGGLR